MERPQEGSWELADSLLQTLSAPLPPDSPVAASYKNMMHSLQTGVASALLACTEQPALLNPEPILSIHMAGESNIPAESQLLAGGDVPQDETETPAIIGLSGRPLRRCRLPQRFAREASQKLHKTQLEENLSCPLEADRKDERAIGLGPTPRCSSPSSSSCEESPAPSQSRTKRLKKKAKLAVTQSSSAFRGVSRHRLTQRWEASLWLNGRQLYLGGFESERDAAAAYDIAALACKGRHAATNFGPESCEQDLLQLQGASKEEIVAFVRRRSSAFSRGRSPFRGVSGHTGRWEARIGCFNGKKNVSFGHHGSEEEAARQYDRALIIEKGRGAKTNFPLADYEQEVAAFSHVLQERHGHLRGAALDAAAAGYQLPLELDISEDGEENECVTGEQGIEKGRGGRPRNCCAAAIFAVHLRKALS